MSKGPKIRKVKVDKQYAICQTCGKTWSGYENNARRSAFSHARRTGHYVEGVTIFKFVYNSIEKENQEKPQKEYTLCRYTTERFHFCFNSLLPNTECIGFEKCNRYEPKTILQ